MAEFVLKYVGPRDSVRQRANQHRAVAISSACFPARRQIVVGRHDRPALDSSIDTGAPMAQEIKE